MIEDLARGSAVPAVAARFHHGLAAGAAAEAERAAREAGLDTVALGGGGFQNRFLLQSLMPLLTAADLRPLVPEKLPPDDGGAAFGQAAVAAWRLAHGDEEGDA